VLENLAEKSKKLESLQLQKVELLKTFKAALLNKNLSF